MHLLPCTSCDNSFPVSPSQAGNQTPCPHCNATVDIPNLGALRLLPDADPAANETPRHLASETSAARRFGFGLFAFIAAGCLLVGGYCGIRWLLIDVPLTTEEHIAGMRDEYARMEPAGLIRDYEEMEEFGLELPEPYQYKIVENARSAWGRNTLIFGGVGLFSILMALVLAATSRGPQSL